jgi:multiple sugar transport system ATP-binding protein
MASVSLRNVTKSFGTTRVIHGIDLEVAHRELVVFVGPSGCGKSTLLRMIAGLEEITGGELFIDGKRMNETPPARRGIAMVFQSYALYPHKTVRDNMGFGLRMAKLDKATIRRKVDDAARVLGLETLLDRRPKDLSGGQRQRVAIGRAIVREPQIFLFDEPLSNLDAGLRGQMRVEIARLHQTLDATMIYVTHDQIEAMTLADKIIVLNAGRIEQVGGPMELYERPANLFVAQFIGSPRMNLFDARVEAADSRECRLRIEGGPPVDLAFGASARLAVGDPVTIGVRPEDLRPSAEGFSLPIQAQVVERLGSQTHVVGTFAGRQVTVVLDGRAPVQPGQAFAVGCGTELLHLFDKNGTALRQ